MERIGSQKLLEVYKVYSGSGFSGILYHADAHDLLGSLDHGTVDLAFLDPPFNLGKAYSEEDPKSDLQDPRDYESWMKGILDQVVNVLAPGGALYLYHLPEWGVRFGAHLDKSLDFRHWIAISMKNSFVRGDRLYPAHYALLYFTKGEPKYFSRPRIELALCRNCGETIKDYGGYKSIIEEKGLNLSDFWEDLSPVRHSNRKLRPQNQLPLKMLQRVIEISGEKGMTYLDPFAGTGTGVMAAIQAELRFIAGDIIQANCRIIDHRIKAMIEKRGKEK